MNRGINMMQKLIRAIKNKKAIIGIIGLGYVGLPLAKQFLESGFNVIGFDIDKNKVDLLNKGISYIKHIQSDFIGKYVKNNNFIATDDFSLIKNVDAIIICVPTPLGIHYEPDIKYIINSAKEIAKYLKKGHIVVLESTTYPGTTEDELLPTLKKSGLKVGKDFFLGFSPEREDPGNKKYTTKNIPKIVSGVTQNCLEVIKNLYEQVIETVFPVSSPKIAESAKLLENIYRSVNIALVNELKIVFGKMGIDIWEVIEAAKTKPFGFHAFYPGPGLGGHCIPIDPFYLTWKAREYDLHTRFIELAGEINNTMPYRVVDTTIRALNSTGKSIKNSRVLILGLAYKPDIDDIRESPSLKLIDIFTNEGAIVSYNDPFIPEIPPTRKYNFSLKSVKITPKIIGQFDAIVISTNHSSYNYELILKNAKLIIDTRNAFGSRGIVNGKVWKA